MVDSLPERRSTVRLLLDTAFCLELIRVNSPRLQRVFDGHVPGEVAVSSMTVAALQALVERSRGREQNRRALEQFLLPLLVVDFDADAARVAGRISGWWAQRSDPAVTHAQLLAAQALQLGALLVTSRPALYAPVPDLHLNTVYAEAGAASAPDPHLASSPLRPAAGTIVAMGSHDMTLDLLGDSLHAEQPQLTLASAHVGSLHGLLALQRHEAHLAGSHLLDVESGEYNLSYVRRFLTAYGIRVVVLGFVRRIQGLIVAHGNPKAIAGFDDLGRDDVRFVNRQPGAGTRVLLDYELQRRRLAPQQVNGYDRLESSHLGVATAIASGAADCGLGIQAAAQAHNLDFVPLCEERYDLVIPVDYFTGPLLAPLLALLRKPGSDFLRRVAALGGYSTDGMGRVLAEL